MNEPIYNGRSMCPHCGEYGVALETKETIVIWCPNGHVSIVDGDEQAQIVHNFKQVQ